VVKKFVIEGKEAIAYSLLVMPWVLSIIMPPLSGDGKPYPQSLSKYHN